MALTREVTSIKKYADLDRYTKEQLEVIYNFAIDIYNVQVDIAEFCDQDPTAKGSVAHKSSLIMLTHYEKLISAIERKLNGI